MAAQLIAAGRLTALKGKLAGVLTAAVQRRGLVVLVGIVVGRDENCAASKVESKVVVMSGVA